LSGIAGLYYLDHRPIDPQTLEQMLARIAYRGPDGSGLWYDGPVGLGHQMLRTTPESLHEQLPLADESGDLIISCDARVDNRSELIEALEIERPRAEITDASLILRAYERWGEQCPERLVGDFAFAIWDRRRKVLFCARDPFGVKPFYYFRSDRIFALASEIKALLALEDVPRRLNETRLADYLLPLLEDKQATLYRDILRIPPAHTLTVTPEAPSLRQYWSLDRGREISLESDGEYIEAFRSTFTEAVRCRLRSAGPVGSRLSGGLDSSAVTCVARDVLLREGRERLHTFSGIFELVPESDERPYIEAVVRQGGVQAHDVPADRLGVLHDWEEASGVSWAEDEPLWSPQLPLGWALCQAAHDQGVRVVLDGDGGDQVVAHGHTYLAELLATGRWLTCLSEARLLTQHLDIPLQRAIKLWAVFPLLPPWLLSIWRAVRGRRDVTLGAAGVPIVPAFAQRMGLPERAAARERAHQRSGHTVRQAQWQELTTGLIPAGLEYNDRLAALFQIEPRYPFYDRRLVELCLALPSRQKLRDGWPRAIVRRSLDCLPNEVRWRARKASLFPAVRHGLLSWNRAQMDDLLVRNPGAIAAYVDVEAARQMYGRYLTESTPWDQDGLALWIVASMARWLRRTGLSSG
jgi:asparagine synthase (glutamine-hydrolysing)